MKNKFHTGNKNINRTQMLCLWGTNSDDLPTSQSHYGNSGYSNLFDQTFSTKLEEHRLDMLFGRPLKYLGNLGYQH